MRVQDVKREAHVLHLRRTPRRLLLSERRSDCGSRGAMARAKNLAIR